MIATGFAQELARSGLAPTELQKFLGSAKQLEPEEMRLLVEQALHLMEDFYVHLPLKQSMYAVNPVQRLRLLRRRIGHIGDREFHQEMISTFLDVRDLHTNYILPDPYRRATAVLPFELAAFTRAEERRYLVSRLLLGFAHASFVPGSIVTHWNGVAIERAVANNAERNAGSNPAARFARGLERMTIRPLMMSLPPDEDWVDVRYIGGDGKAREVRFEWQIVGPPSGAGDEAVSLEGVDEAGLGSFLSDGIDAEADNVRLLKDQVFDEKVTALTRAITASLNGLEALGTEIDFSVVSHHPSLFTFRNLEADGKTLGYIKIASFDPTAASAVPEERVDKFVQEFQRILELMPGDGLILDVRGNPGGNIVAGETLLQMLTSRTIEPERTHFVTTEDILSLCRRLPSWFERWTPSIERAVQTGAKFSQGWPLSDDVNSIGRKYQGPVVLLIDARCYSTTDIFAAGFQDHKIGKVLGTATHTGAGGANVFGWDLLKRIHDLTPGPKTVKQLPKNASFRVAIRRTTRVGDNAGTVLEDFGVEPDEVHMPTLGDLLEDDKDLLARAVAILSE